MNKRSLAHIKGVDVFFDLSLSSTENVDRYLDKYEYLGYGPLVEVCGVKQLGTKNMHVLKLKEVEKKDRW